jgi:acetylglutamate/LysW-gamma-L-alpha-aminoadipate kinase
MEVAVALKAERLLIFADTPGFMRDVNDEHSVIASIRLAEVDSVAEYGKGRARVKLLAAAQAVRRGIHAVGLLDGRGDHPLTRAFEGAGTWITR